MVFYAIIAYTGGEAIANRPLHRFIFYIMAQWLNLHMSSADQSSVWNVGLHMFSRGSWAWGRGGSIGGVLVKRRG